MTEILDTNLHKPYRQLINFTLNFENEFEFDIDSDDN